MVRKVKKPQERRDEILQAGCRLFLAKGYENTTMTDVMKDLGIAKGTIYHYFTSKEDLLGAVIDYFADQQLLGQRKILETTQGNGLERLQQFIRQSIDEDHDELVENLHQPANAGMHIRMLARIISVQAPLYAELIQQGCEEGIFTTDTPLECAEFILSAVQFLTDIGIAPWSKEDLQRRAAAIPTMIESLLQAPPDSFAFLGDILEDPYR